jgi:hypothetical protein
LELQFKLSENYKLEIEKDLKIKQLETESQLAIKRLELKIEQEKTKQVSMNNNFDGDSVDDKYINKKKKIVHKK